MSLENGVNELWPFGRVLNDEDRDYLEGIKFDSMAEAPESLEDFPCLIIGRDKIFYAHSLEHGVNLSKRDLKGRSSEEITSGVMKMIATSGGLIGIIPDVIHIYNNNPDSSLNGYSNSIIGQVEVNLVKGIGSLIKA